MRWFLSFLTSLTIAACGGGGGGGSVSVGNANTGGALAPSNLSGAVNPVGWGAADAARAADIAVVMDSNGRSLAAWTELTNGHYQLKARRMIATDTGTPLSTAGDAAAPQLAVDAAGNALAVWTQYSNARNTVWASHYNTALNVWDTPRMVSSASAVASAQKPDLAMDQAGNAIAVWQQGDGRADHFDAWVTQYNAGSASWSAPAMVSDGINSAHCLSVAINANGQGQLAWVQERGDGTSASSQPADIWVRPVSTQAPWGDTTVVNASGGKANTVYVYGQIGLSVNARGDAAVLWSQRLLPSLPMVVDAALYSPARGWQDAASIVLNTTEDSQAPAVALDDAGNAVAIWTQVTDYSAYGASNRYVAGVGWGTAGHFVDSKLGDTCSPSLAMDGAGNATVVWYRVSGTNAIDLMTDRFTPASGWADPKVLWPVGSDSSMTGTLPLVATNPAGQTLVVWGANLSAVASWL
jgi:hypothetical protein